jgi:hypothetical protein
MVFAQAPFVAAFESTDIEALGHPLSVAGQRRARNGVELGEALFDAGTVGGQYRALDNRMRTT